MKAFMKFAVVAGLLLSSAWFGATHAEEKGSITVMVLATITVFDGTVAQIAFVPKAGKCMMQVVTPEGATHFMPIGCPPDPNDFFGIKGSPPVQKQSLQKGEYIL